MNKNIYSFVCRCYRIRRKQSNVGKNSGQVKEEGNSEQTEEQIQFFIPRNYCKGNYCRDLTLPYLIHNKHNCKNNQI